MGLGSVHDRSGYLQANVQFAWLTWLFGGYGSSRVIHFILTLGYCLFFLVHVIQVILAGWNNFQRDGRRLRGRQRYQKQNHDPPPPTQPTATTRQSCHQAHSEPSAQPANTPSPATPRITPKTAPIAGSPHPPDVARTSRSPNPPPRLNPSAPHRISKATGHSEDLHPQPTDQPPHLRQFARPSPCLGAAAWKSWFWIKDGAHSDGVQGPLRKGLDIDDKIFKHTLSPNHLAKTYPKSAAVRNVRYNSGIGLSANGFDAANGASRSPPSTTAYPRYPSTNSGSCQRPNRL
jgi:hypothetical protein